MNQGASVSVEVGAGHGDMLKYSSPSTSKFLELEFLKSSKLVLRLVSWDHTFTFRATGVDDP